jgi:hypothetical protein
MSTTSTEIVKAEQAEKPEAIFAGQHFDSADLVKLAGVEGWKDERLDKGIKNGHAVVGTHARNFSRSAVLTGVLLREKRRRIEEAEGKRKFGPWLKTGFDGSRSTAYAYIELADRLAPVELLREIEPPKAKPRKQVEAPKDKTPNTTDTPADEPTNEASGIPPKDEHAEDEHEHADTEAAFFGSHGTTIERLRADVEALVAEGVTPDSLDELKALSALLAEAIAKAEAIEGEGEDVPAEDEDIPATDADDIPVTKLTGLSAQNVRAISETFSESLVTTTKTTATFRMGPVEAAELVVRAIAELPGRGHPKASLHAVRRRLVEVAKGGASS